MQARLSNWLNPIIHPNDPALQRQALVVHQLLLGILAILITTNSTGMLFFFINKLVSGLFIGIDLLLVLVIIFVNLRGHVRAASILLCCLFLATGVVLMCLSGGVKSFDVIFILPGTVVAGLTLGALAVQIYTGISLLALLVMLVLQQSGFAFLNILPIPPEAAFIVFTSCMIFMAVPMSTTLHNLDAALKQASQNEARYRSLLENIPAITYISTISPGRPTDYISPQTIALLGYSNDEFLENPELWKQLLHPDDSEAVEQVLSEANGASPVRMEYRLLARDGHAVWILDEARELTDPRTHKRVWLGVWTNITSQRQAESELSELNATLEERVLERTRQLEEANQEMQAFSYSVSHDLRAPLRAMRSYSSILQEEYGAQSEPEALELLGKVIRSGTEMNEKIDALLGLARLSNKPLDLAITDLSKMANEIIATLRDSEPQRSVECTIQPGVLVLGDPILLRTALENLLSNAWKYTGKVPQASLAFSAEMQENGEVVCCVRDNGAGFDMAYAGKLFGTFQRLHNWDEFPGHGIGLASVKKVIQRHGGRIWAHSEPGKGAAFYFTLGKPGGG